MVPLALPRFCGIALLLSIIAFAGCREKEAEKPKTLPKVTVAHPVLCELEDEDEYNGQLVESRTVDVRARVRGHIVKVGFKDGDLVDEGKVLFELDSAPYKAVVNEAIGQQNALEAQKKQAEEDRNIEAELVRKNAGTKQDYDKAVAKVASLASQVVAKQAEVERKQQDVGFCTIRSPVFGKVGKALMTEGNLVEPGAGTDKLAELRAWDPIYISFRVDERALQRYQKMREKDDDKSPPPFRFALDTDDGFPYNGKVTFIDNKVDKATGTIEIRGETANKKHNLVPGFRVRVRVPLQKYSAILVPDEAILSDQEKKYVLVLDKNNVVLRRDVTLGKFIDEGENKGMRAVIPAAKGGLTKDDWVIVNGLQRARVNNPVEPLDAKGQPAVPGTSGGKR